MKAKKPAAPPRRPIAGEEEFRLWLRALCEASSGKAVAKKSGLSPQALSNVLAGRAPLGPKTVARFGYRRRDYVVFEPIEEEGSPRDE